MPRDDQNAATSLQYFADDFRRRRSHHALISTEGSPEAPSNPPSDGVWDHNTQCSLLSLILTQTAHPDAWARARSRSNDPNNYYSINLKSHTMIPEPFEPFDIGNGSDKLFLIGTAWIILFLFLCKSANTIMSATG